MLAMIALVLMGQASSAGPAQAQPLAPLGTLFSADDYPLDAAVREVEGTVGVRLVVGRDGRPLTCKITASSGDTSLDAGTCAILMQRSAFRPARNAQGEAVLDSVATRIRWRLPSPGAPFLGRPFTPHRSAYGVSMASDGSLRCTYELNGASLPSPDCRITRPEVAAILRRLPETSQIFLVRTFAPQSGVIATSGRSYGEPVAESEAEISVDARGRTSECRITIRRLHVDWIPEPVDACVEARAMRFVPGAPDRRARINISTYVGPRIAT
jgi:TonB family protein